MNQEKRYPGLSDEEVSLRKKEGKTNETKKQAEKSIGRILFENFLNPFNVALYLIAGIFLFFVLYLYGSGNGTISDQYFGISKFTFLVPALINSFIGTYQALHSRHVLNRLRIINEPKTKVKRNGMESVIPSSQIVLDDILLLQSGNQASCDIRILEGFCFVDESLLTGEAEPVLKKEGDFLYSGSLLISGSIIGKAVQVGNNTYSSTLSSKVKSMKHPTSLLMKDIYRMIRFLTVLLAAVVLVVMLTLVLKIQIHGNDSSIWGDGTTFSLSSPVTWSQIMIAVGAFAIGVIPTGLVLLTSIALALSIVKLAKQKTLIQELYSLENLSRVDTLCLDKTGTLTDGTMTLEDTIEYDPSYRCKIRSLLGVLTDTNATSEALLAAFGKEEDTKIKEYTPFSSETKSSSIVYEDGTKLVLGAPEYLLKDSPQARADFEKLARQGKRVLALTEEGHALCLFVLKDGIRTSAKPTLEFFYENKVDIKIISGDNALTVSQIAKECHVRDYDKVLSLENLSLEEVKEKAKEYTVFARVLPEQKKALVQAFQKEGRKVAMTGDGVNDILALRAADASITFQKATDAAKSCADVVLLDNDFSHLTEVVFQGRRVVNNIQRSSVLFLMKSFAVFLLALLLIPFPSGQMWYSVENLYLVQTSVIALAGFLLSLEGTKEPIRGNFLKNVLIKAVPNAILLSLSVLLPILVHTISKALGNELISFDNTRTLISLMTTWTGICVCLSMCLPFNRYRLGVVISMVLVSLFFGLAMPTSYIGGKATSFSMFSSSDGNLFHAQFFKEFFQPWNSPVLQSFHSQAADYVLLFSFFALTLVLALLIRYEGDKYQRNKADSRDF